MYEEDGPVLVPTPDGSITMSGINQQVLAIDPTTGQPLELMNPNEEYNFGIDEVLEIPIAQSGVDIAEIVKREDGTFWQRTTNGWKKRDKKAYDNYINNLRKNNPSLLDRMLGRDEEFNKKVDNQADELLEGYTDSIGDAINYSVDTNRGVIDSIVNLNDRIGEAVTSIPGRISNKWSRFSPSMDNEILTRQPNQGRGDVITVPPQSGRNSRETLERPPLTKEQNNALGNYQTLNNFYTDANVYDQNAFENSNQQYADLATNRLNQQTEQVINSGNDPAQVQSDVNVQKVNNSVNKRVPNAVTPSTDGTYTVKKGDWLSSIANANNTTVDELVKLNPNITNPNRIFPGQKIVLPQTSSTPTARTNAQANGLGEQPVPTIDENWVNPDQAKIDAENARQRSEFEEGNTELDLTNVTKTLDTTVPNNDDVILGRFNRNPSTNQLETMMNIMAQGVTPEYMPDMINPRLINYNDINPELYLDELDSQYSRQMQNINPNTTQGQMVNSILGNTMMRERRGILNRITDQNQRMRINIDTQNNQLLTQSERIDDQNRMGYSQRVAQAESVYDNERLKLAGLVDNMQNQRNLMDNSMVMMNMLHDNFKVDSDGTVRRKKTQGPKDLLSKSKFGSSKKYKK